MISFLSFGIEMIVCFVLLDFALEQKWAIVGTAFVAAILLSILSKQKKRDDLKQGGYGKIVVFKESILKQLTRPTEVVAMLRCKFGGLGGGKESGLAFGLDGIGLQLDDVKFCEIKLKQVSRSFAQVITFLPNEKQSPLRLAVALFYLVLRALDTVEDDMELSRFDGYVLSVDKRGVEDARLAAKQRILRDFAKRMQDAIAGKPAGFDQQTLLGFGEGNEKELLENLDVLVRVMAKLPLALQAVILDITKEMGEGMADYIARDLKNGTEDDVDFEKYCHVAAGTVGDGLTRLFAVCGYAPRTLVARKDLWDAMGSFLQRTNIIRDYLEDLVDGRAWWPRSVWEQYVDQDGSNYGKPSLGRLAEQSSIASGKSVQCLDHMIADALELIPSCIDYLESLQEVSVYSFCALPQIMAIATLAECFANEHVFQGVVKIRKGMAAQIMLDLAPINGKSWATMRCSTLQSFLQFAKIIQKKARKGSYQTPQVRRADEMCEKVICLVHAKLATPSTGGASQSSTKRRAD